MLDLSLCNKFQQSGIRNLNLKSLCYFKTSPSGEDLFFFKFKAKMIGKNFLLSLKCLVVQTNKFGSEKFGLIRCYESRKCGGDRSYSSTTSKSDRYTNEKL